MVNYQRGKIYIIRSHKTDDVYIGSTCEPTLARRMAGHRLRFKHWEKTGKGYATSYEILKHGDAYIELLEAFPCDTKDELLRREGALIRETNCVNKDIAGRTVAEWREDNKEVIAVRRKQYYQDNKEIVKARVKRYAQNNAKKIAVYQAQYNQNNKEAISAQKKIYQQNNANKIATQGKQYREDNKAKIQARNNRKMVCPCGVSLRIAGRARHLRSAKHKAYEATQ